MAGSFRRIGLSGFGRYSLARIAREDGHGDGGLASMGFRAGYTAETLYSADQVSSITGVRTATLANWRSRGEGPVWLKVGRKIWYPVVEFEDWMEGLKIGAKKPKREMALSIPSSGPKILRQHRLGRHRTKQDEGGAQGGGSTPAGDGGQGGPAQAGGSVVQ